MPEALQAWVVGHLLAGPLVALAVAWGVEAVALLAALVVVVLLLHQEVRGGLLLLLLLLLLEGV